MKTTGRNAWKSVDEYITAFPKDVQTLLQKVRATIRKAAPGVEETISYQIPTFKLDGRYIIYFAGYKEHIGLYPAPVEHPEFKEALAAYRSGKATAKFALDRPIPLGLITRIVKFKVKESRARAVKKAGK